MNRYRRRLPHWDVVEHPMFVTFRLHGSLPANRAVPPERMTSGEAFVCIDRILDLSTTGPLFLNRPEIADVVRRAILSGDRVFERYDLHAYIVMANHVHMLVTGRVPAATWLRTLKSFTAKEANRILNRIGQPFWQHESFDRLVRNDDEFARTKRYIEWNPVKAGLVQTPEAFPWSSAAPGGCPAASREA